MSHDPKNQLSVERCRVLDRVLVECFVDDLVLFSATLNILRSSAKNLCQQIEMAASAGQWREVSRLAHTLLGSSRTFQAHMVANFALALQNQSQGGQAAELAVKSLPEAVHVMLTELEIYVTHKHGEQKCAS